MDVTPDRQQLLRQQLDRTTSTGMIHKQYHVGCTMKWYTTVLDSKSKTTSTRDITLSHA